MYSSLPYLTEIHCLLSSKHWIYFLFHLTSFYLSVFHWFLFCYEFCFHFTFSNGNEALCYIATSIQAFYINKRQYTMLPSFWANEDHSSQTKVLELVCSYMYRWIIKTLSYFSYVIDMLTFIVVPLLFPTLLKAMLAFAILVLIISAIVTLRNSVIPTQINLFSLVRLNIIWNILKLNHHPFSI